MHELVLILHSWVRWAAILGGVLATYSAFSAADGRNNRWARIFTIALDVQFLLGLVLAVSNTGYSHMADTMKDATARFYAVEHPTIMLLSVAFAHIGAVRARKAASGASARTTSIIFFGLSTLLLLVGTPWPGTHDNRPIFRFHL